MANVAKAALAWLGGSSFTNVPSIARPIPPNTGMDWSLDIPPFNFDASNGLPQADQIATNMFLGSSTAENDSEVFSALENLTNNLDYNNSGGEMPPHDPYGSSNNYVGRTKEQQQLGKRSQGRSTQDVHALPSPPSSRVSNKNHRTSPTPAPLGSTFSCMPICNEVIDDLNQRSARVKSSQNSLDSIPLDELLGLNKRTVNTFGRVMAQPSFMETYACAVLVVVAMEQLATLFQTTIEATPDLRGDKDRPEEQTTDGMNEGSPLPSLKFGSFLVEEGDIMQIRSRIISRELERAIWALGQLSKLLKKAPSPRALGSQMHSQWVDGVASKFKYLLENLVER